MERVAARPGQQKKAGRRDPEVRSVDVTAGWAGLKGKDPNRHYVWVYKGQGDMGPDYYQSIGYDVELRREGGVIPVGAQSIQAGSTIECRGHVLMSCSKERLAEIEQYGVDGATGQALIDMQDKKMLREGGEDRLRGMHGRTYGWVENETTPAEPEQ